MTLPQLYEITTIDSEIAELHERLQALYKQRAELTSTKEDNIGVSQQRSLDTVDLSGIDLSL